MADWGYMIEADSRPALDVQKASLKAIGLSRVGSRGPIFKDKAKAKLASRFDLVERDALFKRAKAGDTIYVHDAACLAYRRQDLARLVTDATRRGLIITELSTGRVFSDPIDPVQLVEFCNDIQRVMKREAMRRYRKNNPKQGRLSEEQLAEAKKLWDGSDLTNAEIAAKFGVTKQTLWSRFGARA